MTIAEENYLAILEQLVSFDTTSHKSNIPLIQWVQEYLLGFDVETKIIPDETGQKYALIAKIGNGLGRGIALNGHTDVVPAIPERWTSDPFKLLRSSDKVYGRGTTDMKGFISLVLAAVPNMIAANLNRPIYIALSYDEEIGCLGTHKLIENLPEQLEIIVGEPTGLRPANRHNGARVQTLSITGIPAHSGRPKDGVNAIAFGQHALAELLKLCDEINVDSAAPSSNLLVTAINGGGALNIIPATCEITWMLRLGDRREASHIENRIAEIVTQIDNSLRNTHPDAGATLSTLCDMPPFIADKTAFDSELFSKLFINMAPYKIDFASEAGFFHQAGHNVVVCGPGDMAQGHTDDEFIEIEVLINGARFMERVIDDARA